MGAGSGAGGLSRSPDPATALAHGDAARFVDEVVELGTDSITCRGRVPAHSPAVTDGAAGAWAALELAAQAAGLLQAAGAAGGTGGPVSGYIVRIRNAHFPRSTFPADTVLVARVARTGGAGALSLFDVRVEGNGEPIATASLGTFALAG